MNDSYKMDKYTSDSWSFTLSIIERNVLPFPPSTFLTMCVFCIGSLLRSAMIRYLITPLINCVSFCASMSCEFMIRDPMFCELTICDLMRIEFLVRRCDDTLAWLLGPGQSWDKKRSALFWL